MSGRKQHYIPQFILRGFSMPKKSRKGLNGKTYVQVYRSDRVFETATDGIAAQRDFYSNPEDTTLDDEITNYEGNSLANIYRALEQSETHKSVPPKQVGELLAHLCIRQASLRKTFHDASSEMFERLIEKFVDERWLTKKFALNKNKPNSFMVPKFDEIYEKLEGRLPPHLKDKETFRLFAHNMMKARSINGLVDQQQLQLFQQIFSDQVESHVRNAHNQSLQLSLAPEVRVEALSKFHWTAIECPEKHEGLILPDCVAIGMDKGKTSPLVNNKVGRTGTIAFPINSRRLLWGSSDKLDKVPFKKINKLLAECSLEFFIAKESNDDFENLKPFIGNNFNQFIETTIKDTMRSI